MKILNNILPVYTSNYQYNNQKRMQFKNNYDTVSFTAYRKIPSSVHGLLPEISQKQVAVITENLNYIKDFFSALKSNPVKASKIRKGYSDLIPAKNELLTFSTGKNSTISVIRSRKNANIIRITVQDDKIIKHFLIDGEDKVISNVNQKNPSILPQKIRYMMNNEIANSQVQYYIGEISKNLHDYAVYLKAQNLQPKKSITKNVKITNLSKISDMHQNIYETVKKSVNKVKNLFSLKQEELPSHITPLTDSKSGKVKGLSVKTSDGGELRFSKKLNPMYQDSLIYLAFEKIKPDGSQSFMSIDLNTYKFLKMKEKGKPMVSNHCVHEYDIEEVKNRNFVEKLEEYVEEISHKKVETKQQTKVVSVKEEQTPKVVEPENVNELPQKTLDILSSDIEQRAKEKAVKDAKLFSDTYFSTFMEQLKLNLKTKMDTFGTQLDEIIKGILQ